MADIRVRAVANVLDLEPGEEAVVPDDELTKALIERELLVALDAPAPAKRAVKAAEATPDGG